MIKLIATDMDGTFLTDGKTYNRDLFKQTMKKLQEQRVYFVVASSNQHAQLKSFFEDSEFKGNIYYLSENGGLIFKDDELLEETFIEKSLADALGHYLYLELSHKTFIISNKESAYIDRASDQDFKDYTNTYFHELTEVESGDLLDKVNQTVKFTIYVDPNMQRKLLEDLRAKFGEQLKIVSSEADTIDIMSKKVSKGQGLITLSKILDIDGSEMAAFGNEENDLTMLQYVNYAYAMQESNSILFDNDFQVIGSNNEDSVLETINELLNE